MRYAIAVLLLFPLALSALAQDEEEVIATLEELAFGFQQVTALVQDCLQQDELDCTNLLEAAGQIGAAFNTASNAEDVCSTDRRSFGYRRSQNSLSCAVAGFGIWGYMDTGGSLAGVTMNEWSSTLNDGVMEAIDQAIRDAMEKARVTVEEVQ